MSLENKIWFNQILLYHKDAIFNTYSSLDISITNNTSDFKSFSALSFNISITNQTRRVINLNFQNIVNLLNGLKDITNNLNEKVNSISKNKIELQRKIHNKVISFEFSWFKDEIIVSISISQSGDVALIILPYDVFNSIGLLIKSYINDYIKLNLDFTSKNLICENLDETKIIRNSIKTIPSSILLNNSEFVQNSIEEIPQDLITGTQKITEEISDFDNFLSKNIDTVLIPELNSPILNSTKPEPFKVNSSFIFDVLEGDLSKFEFLMTSIPTSENPIDSLSKTILEKIKLENDSKLFPTISEKNFNSLVYSSKCLFSYFFFKYINENVQVPSSLPILRYYPKFIGGFNAELAYDLLIISLYVRCLKSKLLSREGDSTRNKSIFYLALRLFTDALSISFLEKIDINIIKTCVLNRFKYYNSVGFFSSYDKLLNSYNLKPITEDEISVFLDEFGDKVIYKTKDISEFHNDYNNENKLFRLPYENNLSLEQIIKEVIPTQINIFNKIKNIKDEDEIIELIMSSNLSEDIKKLMVSSEGKKEKLSNLVRAINFNIDGIPNNIRNKVIEYVENLKNSNFDFNNNEIKTEELNENVIKVLYTWNESDKNETYTDFMFKVEECAMTKDLILVKYKKLNNELVPKEDWDLLSLI